MMDIDKRIEEFIVNHHVMTIATIGIGGSPRTANLFYAYNSGRGEFIFTSSVDTNHAKDMLSNSSIGANIVVESSMIGSLNGLQIEGIACRVEGDMVKLAKSRYIKRFPFAVVADLELWVFTANHFKLTDNRLGFGKKVIWNRV